MGNAGLFYLHHLFRYIKDEHQQKYSQPLPNQQDWTFVKGTTTNTPQQLNGMSIQYSQTLTSRFATVYLLTSDLNVSLNNLTGFDCGVFTCFVADFLSINCSLTFNQADVTRNGRERILLAILNGRALI
jgi:hypothetical protein